MVIDALTAFSVMRAGSVRAGAANGILTGHISSSIDEYRSISVYLKILKRSMLKYNHSISGTTVL
jgi:hypothetical protein